MARAIPITEEFSRTRGRQMVELIDGDLMDRAPIISKLKTIRDYYHGDIKRTLRYAGQPNLHLPVVTEKVEGLVLKAMGALYGAQPFVNVRRPHQEPDPDRTQMNEAFLGWAFDIDIPDSYRVIQRWVRGSFLDGPSVLMPEYVHETRMGIQTAMQKIDWMPGEFDFAGGEVTEPRRKLPLEILLMQFGPSADPIKLVGPKGEMDISQDVDDFDGLVATVNFRENRVDYENVQVSFYAARHVDEVELCIRRPVTVCDSVVLRNVEFEDLIVPYRARDLQSAPRVTRQYWLTIADVEKRVKSGEWTLDENDMQALRAQGRSEREEQRINNEDLKDQRDEQVGEIQSNINRAYNFEPFVDNRILIFEVFCRDDADEDGEAEEVIHQIPAYIERIARTDYLESDYPHGHRPFCALHGVQIDDRYYSIPIAQWLLPINQNVNIILNQVHEAQEVINNPFFFYEPMAFGDNMALQDGVHPGMGVPVANAKGIFFPSFPQQPLANLQAVDSLLLFADRLTMSPQSSGSSQVRNAPRTARGTLALLSEASAKVDSFITEAQRGGWREMVYQVHGLYRHYGPDEKWFWVTGEKKPSTIARGDMEGRFEYIFEGNSTNTNKEVRRSISMQRFQVLSVHPTYLQNPMAMRELILDFLRHNSEGVNVDKLDPGMGMSIGNHPPMSQESEIELILAGQTMSVLSTDDHAGHMRILRSFMNGRQFEALQSWQIALLAAHFAEHSRQMVAMQGAGAIQGGMAGASNNMSPMGGELSGLEGGIE